LVFICLVLDASVCEQEWLRRFFSTFRFLKVQTKKQDTNFFCSCESCAFENSPVNKEKRALCIDAMEIKKKKESLKCIVLRVIVSFSAGCHFWESEKSCGLRNDHRCHTFVVVAVVQAHFCDKLINSLGLYYLRVHLNNTTSR